MARTSVHTDYARLLGPDLRVGWPPSHGARVDMLPLAQHAPVCAILMRREDVVRVVESHSVSSAQ